MLSNYNGEDISCTGACDGIAIANPSGGVGPYDFLWDDGQVTQVAIGLCAGEHIVTVTDATGTCTGTDTIELFDPPLLTVDATAFEFAGGFEISCPGQTDGQASASASGGVGAYNFLWSDGQVGSTAVGLSEGFEFVVVTDANLCTAIDTVFLVEPPPISAAASAIEDVSCLARMDGSISLSLGGGSGSYSIMWSDGSTSPVRNDLDLGTYMVEIEDIVGCDMDTTFTIGMTPQIEVAIDSTIAPSCSNSADGGVQLDITGGTSPYNVRWSNGFIGDEVMGMPAGDYVVNVQDDRNCYQTLPVSISSASQLKLSAFKVNPSCGKSDGAIFTGVSGASGGVDYLWSDGSTGESLEDLSAGFYELVINDDFCMVSKQYLLDNKFSHDIDLILTPSACNANSGSAQALPIGGAAPYSWFWSDGQVGEVASSLAPGKYWVAVEDDSSCISHGWAQIEADNDLGLTTSITAPGFCEANDALGIVNVSLGTAPYTFDWAIGAIAPAASGLRSGVYPVFVSDVEDCRDTILLVVEDIAASSTINTMVSDCGSASGAAQITPDGGTAPYDIFWSTNETSLNITGVAPLDEAWVYVDDALGCRQILSFDVPGSNGVLVEADPGGISCVSLTDGFIETNVLDGLPNYIYNWADGINTPNRDMLEAISYELEVIDSSSCQVSGIIQIGDDCADPLIAFDDYTQTVEAEVVIVDVLLNDIYPFRDDIFTALHRDPEHGTATGLSDGSFEYVPNAGFLGIDSFEYVLCNGFGLCDTATVFVEIIARFELPNAISPNGDGINDFFLIRGLDEFPNNVLSIFNRWGDEILVQSNYDGSWNGTFNNEPLADGTYYYILDLGDGSEPLHSFLVIQR